MYFPFLSYVHQWKQKGKATIIIKIIKTLLKRSNNNEQMIVVVSCMWIFLIIILLIMLMFKTLMFTLIISKHLCMSPNIWSDTKLCKTGSLRLLNLFVLWNRKYVHWRFTLWRSPCYKAVVCVLMPAEGNFHTGRLYFESTPRGRWQTAQSPCSAFRDQRVKRERG